MASSQFCTENEKAGLIALGPRSFDFLYVRLPMALAAAKRAGLRHARIGRSRIAYLNAGLARKGWPPCNRAAKLGASCPEPGTGMYFAGYGAVSGV